MLPRLERRLDEMGRHLVVLVLVIAAIVMVTGWLRGETWWVMIEVGISLAVAAVPEGLPTVTTLILALGVLRMSRERALVRRLSAVETLGSTTVICSDKTGTLTENRMTVREYQLANGNAIKLESQSPASEELLTRAIRASVLCNEASFHPDLAEKERATGDPTEIALLVTAHELKVDVVQMRAEYPKLAERPFDAESKRMTTIHRVNDGTRLALSRLYRRFGFSVDGVGFSNNPRLSLARPSASSVRVTASGGVTPLSIVMNYRRGLLSVGPIEH